MELYLVFLKIGFCSFGGLSMIPVINQEMVNHGWMTLEEAHAYAPSCNLYIHNGAVRIIEVGHS